MTLATPPRPVDRPGHALAHLLLPDELRLTAEQFEAVCLANPDAVLELDASGHVIHMTPTGSETGVRASGLPLKLFDSSSGFRLPDGSVLSPDAYQLNGAQLGWLLIPEQQAVVNPSASMPPSASMLAPSFPVCRSICWRSGKGDQHHPGP